MLEDWILDFKMMSCLSGRSGKRAALLRFRLLTNLTDIVFVKAVADNGNCLLVVVYFFYGYKKTFDYGHSADFWGQLCSSAT